MNFNFLNIPSTRGRITRRPPSLTELTFPLETHRRSSSKLPLASSLQPLGNYNPSRRESKNLEDSMKQSEKNLEAFTRIAGRRAMILRGTLLFGSGLKRECAKNGQALQNLPFPSFRQRKLGNILMLSGVRYIVWEADKPAPSPREAENTSR